MSEPRKSILVVEDEDPQREGIIKTLAQYQFSALGGATIAQTLELLRAHKDNVAVVVIDMKVSEFPDYREQAARQGSPITGIGLAKTVLRESKIQRPEIVIHSIRGDRAEYYKQAIEAGASAYSNKADETDRNKFLSIIHALVLKHSFQPNSFNESEIGLLAEGHANSVELLEYFYHNKLARELDLCLANAPHVLLFRDKGAGTEPLRKAEKFICAHSNVNGIPDGQEFDYTELYRRILNQRKLEQVSRHNTYTPEPDLFLKSKGDRLKDFIFIELVNVGEADMALGIMDPFPVQDALGTYPFSTQALAEALIEYASPALEAFVQKLLFRWREKLSVKIDRVETLVGLSSHIQRRLGPIVRNRRLSTSEGTLELRGELTKLSNDLAEYNRALSELLDHKQTPPHGTRGETTRLSDIVREIQADYDRRGHFDEFSITVSADCLLPVGYYYVSQALRPLLAWAFHRRAEAIGEEGQVVRIRCGVHGNWLEVYFQDSSERLSKRVREAYLFEPMSPLHVAQMIIEVGCYGRLVDATDELQTKIGHLFKIRLLQH